MMARPAQREHHAGGWIERDMLAASQAQLSREERAAAWAQDMMQMEKRA